MFKGTMGGNKTIGTIFQHALSWTADRLISAFSNARRVQKLKNEVAALNAHIELINVCHADRLAALEHEHRQKIGAQVDELRGLVARVLPPNLDRHAQIIISGEAAHELWGKFAFSRATNPDHRTGVWCTGRLSPMRSEPTAFTA